MCVRCYQQSVNPELTVNEPEPEDELQLSCTRCGDDVVYPPQAVDMTIIEDYNGLPYINGTLMCDACRLNVDDQGRELRNRNG